MKEVKEVVAQIKAQQDAAPSWEKPLVAILARYEGIGMKDPECAREVRQLWHNSEDAPPLDYRPDGLRGFELAFLYTEVLLDGKAISDVFYLNRHTKTCFTYSLPEPHKGPVWYRIILHEHPELREACDITPDGLLYRIIRFEELEIVSK